MALLCTENQKQSFSFDTKMLKFPWDKIILLKITVFRVNKNTELRVLCDTWSGGGKCCLSKQYVNELEHCSDMYSYFQLRIFLFKIKYDFLTLRIF